MSLDIPNEFHSDSDDKPFTSCKVCDCDLSEGQVPYTIEKAYKRVDEERDITLFELAICLPCAEKQSQKMSKESREYMMRMIDSGSLMERQKLRWDDDWRKDWKEACFFHGEKVKVGDEYHVVGYFQGNKIISQMTPFIIGQNFIEKIQENLSAETKEEMDRFGGQFLGPDPTLRELVSDYQFVMV